MLCPHCGRPTGRLITRATRDGKLITGCPSCYEPAANTANENLYTGRKIWTGVDADGPRKNTQKIHDWLDKTKEKAARMRRTAHHSRF